MTETRKLNVPSRVADKWREKPGEIAFVGCYRGEGSALNLSRANKWKFCPNEIKFNSISYSLSVFKDSHHDSINTGLSSHLIRLWIHLSSHGGDLIRLI